MVGFTKRTKTGAQIIERTERKLKPKLCNHRVAKKMSQRTFRCESLSEETREIIFEKFWKIESWPEKKSYLQGL